MHLHYATNNAVCIPTLPFDGNSSPEIASDILRAADRGDVTFLCLLDLSAAFDTVDHDILFDRLERHSVYVDWSFNG